MKRFAFDPASKRAHRPVSEDGHEALMRVRDLLPSVDVSSATVNLNIPRACATAIGALPAIQALRPAILDQLPRLPIEKVDALEDLATALYYAHALCRPRPRGDTDMEAHYEEARPLRKHLLASAELLGERSLLDPSKVAELRAGRGTMDLANDLIGLSLLFRRSWAAVRSKSTVSQADCERADLLGRLILARSGRRLLGTKESTPHDDAYDERLRCFVLFVESYDWCRRAATYLRWKEQDGDALVPSLYRRTRSRSVASPKSGSTDS
ncbi:MAG: hypothetical protein WKG00_24630 [Polyangiaceae bacterium]